MRNKNLLSIAKDVIKLETKGLRKLQSSLGKSFEKIEQNKSSEINNNVKNK